MYSRSDLREPFTPPPVQPDQSVFGADTLMLFRQIVLDGEPMDRSISSRTSPNSPPG